MRLMLIPWTMSPLFFFLRIYYNAATYYMYLSHLSPHACASFSRALPSLLMLITRDENDRYRIHIFLSET
jgi:hypothetical protein